MADTLMLWDGSVQTVFSLEDFLQLVDEYMGMEARAYLESRLGDSDAAWSYVEETEKERDGWKDRHRETIREIRDEVEMLSKLIHGNEPDCREISNTCSRISTIIRREMNA